MTMQPKMSQRFSGIALFGVLIALESGPTSRHGCSHNARKLPSGQTQSALNLKMEQCPSITGYWEDNLRKQGSAVVILP